MNLLRSTKWNASLILLRDFGELVALCKVISWKIHIPVRTHTWPPRLIFAEACHGNYDRNGQSYPVEYYLEPVEEYSEGKIHMSESGKGKVNTGEILESVARPSLFMMNEHAIANVHLDLIFLLRIMFVKIYFYKLAVSLKRYKVI